MDDLKTAEQCKELGNALFMAKQSLAALEAYTKGLDMEPRNHLLLSNRAMVNSALGDNAAALADAQVCIDCEPTFVKGYFRKASAELQMNLLAEAAASIAAGKKLEPSEGKSDFARLEKMLSARKTSQGNSESVPAKGPTPTSKDYFFDVGSPIGEGNYTSIVCATHKTTGNVFALKLIQKSDVDRIKKRHPNVHNEINMEKWALKKLKHPGIVSLYSTFQDYYCLYFVLEHCTGGELWDKLSYKGFMVNVPESLARRWVAEIVEVVAYIHPKGIVHRDLKPENIMLTSSGHIKVIDFGTSKELRDEEGIALNGPEFVGTSDYMAPEMISGVPATSYPADLWALGCILVQLLTGRTPFKAPSPYLTFLKIKRANTKYFPEVLSETAADLISNLLVLSPDERLGANSTDLESLKSHAFFQGLDFGTLFDEAPDRVPKLSELCLRAVGEATVAARTRDRRLLDLSQPDRRSVMHFLARIERLHEPRVLRSFYDTLADARCLRALPSTREYVGLEYDTQGHWKEPFVFAHVCFGNLLSGDAVNKDLLGSQMKSVVSAVNRLRPKFFVVAGDLSLETDASLVADFRSAISRVSESIPLVFVTAQNRCVSDLAFARSFGADWYGFWFGGMRGLVLNSALIADHETPQSKAQEEWFDGECEQGQLGGHHLVVFTYHPWFEKGPHDEDTATLIPKTRRLWWLRKMQLNEVKYLFAGSANATSTRVLRPGDLPKLGTREDPIVKENNEDEDEEAEAGRSLEVSCTSLPSGLRVAEVFENRIDHKCHHLDAIPDRADLLRVK